MKMIFKIAKTELRNLFYSPVAWFLSIAFLVQCAVYYTGIVQGIAKWQDVALTNQPRFKGFEVSLTRAIFLGSDSLFSSVLQNLFLFVPLLTMGLISREINNGTIKLLYSSPISVRQIVLGKYTAIMLYNLVLVLLIGIFIISGFFNIVSPDYGVLLSAVLGFYLLMCAYTAIGLFMSSLTTYQIVSAIACFLMIFILTRIGGLWQRYDFVRDLTYFLSMYGRTEKMLSGLITTREVIYFLLIMYLFVSFTLIKLRSATESRPWYVNATRYVAVMISVLAAGYISSRPAYIGYWDTTANKVNTLHPYTQKIIQELGDEPLEVTLYSNLLGGGIDRTRPMNRNDYLWGFWEKYVRFKPDIQFKYVHYQDIDDHDSTLYKTYPGKTLSQIAGLQAELMEVDTAMYLHREEIRKQIDMAPEDYRAVMQLKYKGRTTFLRTYNDPIFWPEEMQVAPALKRLLAVKLPKVLFTTGNLERSPYKKGEREFWLHSLAKANRYSLLNLGFEADTISLDHNNIPKDVSILVLADPKTELSATVKARLRDYISGGGNLFIMGEPGKQQLLNPVLQQLGVRLMNGTTVEVSTQEMPHMVKPYITYAGANLAEDPFLIELKRKWGEDSIFLLQPGVASIAYADSSAFSAKPLLLTAAKNNAWIKAGVLVTDSVPPVFDALAGDTMMPAFTTSIQLTRQIHNKQQRIILNGDADLMSNLRSAGGFIGRAFYSWLDYNEYPVYAPMAPPKDQLLTIKPVTANILKMVYVWVLPAMILLLGTIILIRRKRQ